MITASNPVLIDYVPTSQAELIKNEILNLPKRLKQYLLALFPIFQWIHRYNFSWLVQDAIAGITVGMLIVPQGIAYAKIANLDPQYGLYTSFVGVTLYCFFGTSKDISIGPITVVSLLVGQAITNVTKAHPEISAPEIAVHLSLFAGIVTLVIGLIRLGILVDFISEPAIAGYMTGSAITISFGQWPKVFGLNHVNTHTAPYRIFYHFFQHLKETRLDAAFGLTALVILYTIKYGGNFLSQRYPKIKKPMFFLGIMRSGLVVIAGTGISYAINKNHREDPLIDIIQTVPAGFDSMQVPSLNFTVLKEASGILPSIILILILEHVSVAKSFGRINNYSVNANQEILAIGISNIIGSFFGAYPCTGAFSRTAVMARSGAKTPMAGVFSGAVVVLALYVLTPAFYYIPESILASVVIHAVIDLISGPTFLKALWKQSQLEFLIFLIAVIITCFIDVETGIYVSVGLSLLLMLLRLARPSVSSLGRVKLGIEDHASYHKVATPSSSASITTTVQHQEYLQYTSTPNMNALNDVYGMDKQARYIYVEENDQHYVRLFDPLPPGLVVIRLSNSILYPNANYVSECIIDIVKSHTRPGSNHSDRKDVGEKEEIVWSQPSAKEASRQHPFIKPCLEYIVFDFSAVDNLDATAIHTLHSVQQTLNRYAGGKPVEWHFCHLSRHVRQLLIDAGFGLLPLQQIGDIMASYETTVENETMIVVNNNSKNVHTQYIEQISQPSKLQNFASLRSIQTMNSLYDPMNMTDINNSNYTNFSSPASSPTTATQQQEDNSVILFLPNDRYPAFHWDVEAAVYSISGRCQHNQIFSSTYSVATTY